MPCSHQLLDAHRISRFVHEPQEPTSETPDWTCPKVRNQGRRQRDRDQLRHGLRSDQHHERRPNHRRHQRPEGSGIHHALNRLLDPFPHRVEGEIERHHASLHEPERHATGKHVQAAENLSLTLADPFVCRRNGPPLRPIDDSSMGREQGTPVIPLGLTEGHVELHVEYELYDRTLERVFANLDRVRLNRRIRNGCASARIEMDDTSRRASARKQQQRKNP
ncbi:hypothetical protein LZ198_16815 [Myxococcus sp. K15C18031901]|nr:hypothetical protein [Myxococcus dinghuensis]MCP3100533.1 hypothetical protein [Myxococcus dinghuensis]